MIHRDLKAANCFIDTNGIIKLGDLNVSRRLKKGDLARTQVGTPFYISPEIFRRKAYTFSSDIWSLGCILYELAALKPPFNGRDMAELSRNVQRAYFPKISHHYSRELWETIVMLLKPNPKDRPKVDEILRLPIIAKWRTKIHEEQSKKEEEARAMERDTPRVPDDASEGRNGCGKDKKDNTRFSRASLFSAYSSAYTDTNNTNNTNTNKTNQQVGYNCFGGNNQPIQQSQQTQQGEQGGQPNSRSNDVRSQQITPLLNLYKQEGAPLLQTIKHTGNLRDGYNRYR